MDYVILKQLKKGAVQASKEGLHISDYDQTEMAAGDSSNDERDS